MMRKALLLLLLFACSFALSISISPTYVRMPKNTTQEFVIEIKEGEGKLYKVEAFGPYLSWNAREEWIGPYGKKIYVRFSPREDGKYTITIKVGNETAYAKVDVYSVVKPDLDKKIAELEKKVKSKEEKSKLEEIKRLYNESKYELAEIKIRELEELLKREGSESKSIIPQLVLLLIVAMAALISSKLIS